jgi:hypothetical protein
MPLDWIERHQSLERLLRFCDRTCRTRTIEPHSIDTLRWLRRVHAHVQIPQHLLLQTREHMSQPLQSTMRANCATRYFPGVPTDFDFEIGYSLTHRPTIANYECARIGLLCPCTDRWVSPAPPYGCRSPRFSPRAQRAFTSAALSCSRSGKNLARTPRLMKCLTVSICGPKVTCAP